MHQEDLRRATARVARVLVSVFVLIAATIGAAQTPPPSTSQSGSFAGRWEIFVRTPEARGNAGMPAEIPFAIVEISGSGSAITGKLIDGMTGGPATVTLNGVTMKGDEIEITLAMMSQKLAFTGKRVDDHIEGTADASGQPAKWIGRPTTKDKLPDLMTLMAEQEANAPPDQKAYDAVMDIENPSEREAALKKFQADFPKSALHDSATLQIALAKTAPYKAAAIQNFIDTAPPGELREEAEYELTRTMSAGKDRIAAEERFIQTYPQSIYRATIYNTWLDGASGRNVDEARVKRAIDGMLEAAPDRTIATGAYTINPRADTLNTIADRLMKREVMLDRALELIQEAVRLDGDKAEPDSLAIHTTTLGQVLFKLKRYDEAGDALKRAVQISGRDGDGETQLFLGKFYEVKKQDDLALEAYLKATDKGSPLDTKTSLERLYVKRYGSLASLDKTLDEKYRARGVGFDPGHYTRPAAAEPVRVVLAELFTGAECPPCVAADLAFDGMGERYSSSAIAVLVYHLHIPAPDPLANADAVARAKYYATDATPTAVFDGMSKTSGGGDRSMAQASFGEYTNIVDKRLATAPLAVLNLKADVKANMLGVSGEAKLLPAAADRASHVAMHVALAESDVRYLGSNGVRFHNLVVRKLLDGPQGTLFDPTKGTASIAQSIELTAVGGLLNEYLSDYEKTKKAVKFKERPTTVDASKLVVVAFVQDDKTKEVLQAVVITPVGK